MINKSKLKGSLLLLTTAIIWGTAFVFQRKATKLIDAFSFNALRASITTIFLFAIYFITKKKNKVNDNEELSQMSFNKTLLFALFCGIALFAACSLQQFGLEYTSVSKSGFLTSTQVVIVPILAIFLKKKAKIQVWISAILAMVGFYIMSINEKFLPTLGDTLTILGAVFFSIQVLLCDHVSNKVNVFQFSALFSLVLAILSSIAAFIFESPNINNILESTIPLLYVGIISGVGATLTQMYGLKYCLNPSVATIIMSLQSVFALICGMLFLKELITLKEAIGCIIVFIAVVISQISFKIINKK